MKVLISTVPFGKTNSYPIELLENNNIEYLINPLNKKFTSSELAQYIEDVDVLIAGTECIDSNVLAKAKKLKLIARVGIGLDGIDLLEARKRGIKVTYTPDAPAPAVAELTIGLMLQLARRIGMANKNLQQKHWNREFGYRLSEIDIGIIGSGRIASRVLRRISAFGSPNILINSLERNDKIAPELKLNWVSKKYIYQNSDLISLHIPLTNKTKDMITYNELKQMRSNCMLINTSRGGIVNEACLEKALKNNIIHSAALDVFEQEPYKGPLTELNNCFLTSHMGSMSYDCRERMEIEAVEEVILFKNGNKQNNLVPNSEYILREI